MTRHRRLRFRLWREARHDVVFYAPWVGAIVTARKSLPPGGAETQVLALAKSLSDSGLRVAIVAFGRPADLPAQFDGVNLVPRAKGAEQRFVGKAIEAARIVSAVWRSRPRTVVLRGGSMQLGLFALLGRVAGYRLVFASSSDVDFEWEQLQWSRQDLLLYKLGIRLADGIVVQTEGQIALCETACRRRPTLIKSIRSPTAPQRAAPEAFLWVGRLAAYKRPLDYVALARALPEARFWMVGVPTSHQEQDRAVVQRLAAEAASVPNLELLQPRPHAALQALITRAVAVVNTSDFEGMPNVLLEAWSMGVPALVLRHDPGGVVRAHGLGEFADGSSKQFVELARALWTTRGRRERLSGQCRAYIENNHAPERIAAAWIAVLGHDPSSP